MLRMVSPIFSLKAFVTAYIANFLAGRPSLAAYRASRNPRARLIYSDGFCFAGWLSHYWL
jgi:hypothetical protein